MAVTPAMFEQQVAHLRHECTILSLRQVTGFIKETKRFPVNSVVITFDDGYLDNYTYAFPILEKYNVPATIFLTTDFVNGDSLLWWDELSQLIKYASRSFCTIHLRGVNRIIKVETEQQKTRAYKHLVKVLRDVKEISQVEVLRQLRDALQPEIPVMPRMSLNWAEIREMEAGGINFGSHTCSHTRLSNLDDLSIHHELRVSKDLLEDKLSSIINTFAFPYGAETDFDERSIRFLENDGYQIAVTTEMGSVRMTTDLMRLPRVHVRRNDTFELFKAKVSGLYPLLYSIAQKSLRK